MLPWFLLSGFFVCVLVWFCVSGGVQCSAVWLTVLCFLSSAVDSCDVMSRRSPNSNSSNNDLMSSVHSFTIIHLIIPVLLYSAVHTLTVAASSHLLPPSCLSD